MAVIRQLFSGFLVLTYWFALHYLNSLVSYITLQPKEFEDKILGQRSGLCSETMMGGRSPHLQRYPQFIHRLHSKSQNLTNLQQQSLCCLMFTFQPPTLTPAPLESFSSDHFFRPNDYRLRLTALKGVIWLLWPLNMLTSKVSRGFSSATAAKSRWNARKGCKMTLCRLR